MRSNTHPAENTSKRGQDEEECKQKCVGNIIDFHTANEWDCTITGMSSDNVRDIVTEIRILYWWQSVFVCILVCSFLCIFGHSIGTWNQNGDLLTGWCGCLMWCFMYDAVRLLVISLLLHHPWLYTLLIRWVWAVFDRKKLTSSAWRKMLNNLKILHITW